MNPNAKEFVPAHLLKKRQNDDVGELTKQIGGVDIDDSKKENGETSSELDSGDAKQTATTTSSTNKSQDQVQGNQKSSDNNDSKSNCSSGKVKNTGQPSEQRHKAQHNTPPNHNNNDHQAVNGDSHDLDDDRYLLKAGENYCEFNGEQFIIPGEDDQYADQDPEIPGYDFGNAEDNEDEDVCNAYEEFLNELP